VFARGFVKKLFLGSLTLLEKFRRVVVGNGDDSGDGEEDWVFIVKLNGGSGQRKRT
jgi:hypothetical protein